MKLCKFLGNKNVFVARLLKLYRIQIAFQNAIVKGSCRFWDNFLTASLTTCRRISGSKVCDIFELLAGECRTNEKIEFYKFKRLKQIKLDDNIISQDFKTKAKSNKKGRQTKFKSSSNRKFL